MIRARLRLALRRSAVLPFLFAVAPTIAAQPISLQLDPAATSVKFTLAAALHAVHGTFLARPSALQFDLASGQVSGQIFVDAKSGQTGNGMRDRKMNNEVIESERYPEISFRPLRIEGNVAGQGKSAVIVHGIFNVHGADHEVTVPVQIEMNADRWTATAQFTISYAKWGMKNPSTLFLRVNDSVDIDLALAGTVVRRNASPVPWQFRLLQ